LAIAGHEFLTVVAAPAIFTYSLSMSPQVQLSSNLAAFAKFLSDFTTLDSVTLQLQGIGAHSARVFVFHLTCTLIKAM